MLDEGRYKGNIREWGFSESRNGSPRFEITVALTHAEDEGGAWVELDAPLRRSVFFYLTEGAIGISAAGIRSLGYTDTSLDRLDPDHEDAHNLEGREVVVKVNHEPYMGRDVEKVELVRGYQPRKPVSALQSFAAASLAFAAAQAAEKKGQDRDAGGDPHEPAPAGRRRRK